jgi:hypothetical protein
MTPINAILHWSHASTMYNGQAVTVWRKYVPFATAVYFWVQGRWHKSKSSFYFVLYSPQRPVSGCGLNSAGSGTASYKTRFSCWWLRRQTVFWAKKPRSLVIARCQVTEAIFFKAINIRAPEMVGNFVTSKTTTSFAVILLNRFYQLANSSKTAAQCNPLGRPIPDKDKRLFFNKSCKTAMESAQRIQWVPVAPYPS